MAQQDSRMDPQDSQKESQKSRLKELITRGKEQGYLTYAEVTTTYPLTLPIPSKSKILSA